MKFIVYFFQKTAFKKAQELGNKEIVALLLTKQKPNEKFIETQFSTQMRDIHQNLQKLKGKTREKMELNLNQINQTFQQIQSQIFYPQSSRNLEKIENIGTGTRNKFTKVVVNQFYTLKEMNDENITPENIQRQMDEFKIMLMLKHPNILKTYGQFIDDQKQKLSILLEYCPIDLEKVVQNKMLSKVQQVYFIYQIAKGMKYVHSQNIIHHNLKPSNILLSEYGIIKIGDFDKAQIVKSKDQFEGIDDIYAFGSIVHFILSGDDSLSEEKISVLSPFAQKLISDCCFVDRKSRTTFEKICDVLESNHFNLASLSEIEIQEAISMINQYKLLILHECE